MHFLTCVQVCVWGRCGGEGVIVDVNTARVRHYPGAIVGPDPFALPLSNCLFDSKWLAIGLTEEVRSREKEDGGGINEAVAIASMVQQWFASKDVKAADSRLEALRLSVRIVSKSVIHSKWADMVCSGCGQ